MRYFENFSQTPSRIDPAWFCVRSKPKHEHIAAAHLGLLSNVEVFYPRLRLRKATRRGVVWTTESLFPNYLFARFVLPASLDEVRFTVGVHQVVHFAHRWPSIPDQVIQDLRDSLQGCDLHVLEDGPHPGDSVKVVQGPFSGLSAVVLRSLPAKQRVQILIDMLGRSTQIELSLHSIVTDKDSRLALVPGLAAAG